MIKVRAVEADVKQFDNVVESFRQCVYDKAGLQPLLARYVEMISCFDGSDDAYAKAEPIIDEIVSRDLATYAKDGSRVFDFEGFKSFASAFAREGNVATIEEANIDTNGIRVVIRNIVDGIDQGPCAQIGTVKDGQIARWSAVPDEASLIEWGTSSSFVVFGPAQLQPLGWLVWTSCQTTAHLGGDRT